MAFGHLRMSEAVGAVRVECVEDVIAVVGGDGGGGEDRVEEGEVGLGDEAEGGGFRGLGDGGRGEKSGGALDEAAAMHGVVSPGIFAGTSPWGSGGGKQGQSGPGRLDQKLPDALSGQGHVDRFDAGRTQGV